MTPGGQHADGRSEGVDAFALLYDASAAGVYGMLLHLLGADPARAEQAAEDVYAEVWHERDRADPASSLTVARVMKVARAVAADRARTVAGDDRGASSTRAAYVALRQALPTLTAAQVRTVELACHGACPLTEVARLLVVSHDTAADLVRFALVELRGSLALGRGDTSGTWR